MSVLLCKQSYYTFTFRLQTPLHKAAWYGYLDICKVLVENGASLFRQDYQVYIVLCRVYTYENLYNLCVFVCTVCVCDSLWKAIHSSIGSTIPH